MTTPLRSSVHTDLLLPDSKGLCASAPVVGSSHKVAPWAEVAVDHRVCGQEPLCLVSRFEPLHLSLSSPGRCEFSARLFRYRLVRCRISGSTARRATP